MKKVLTTAILILCVVQLFAQQASLTATVSKPKVGLSERFQLTITLINGGSIKDFRPPAMADFLVMGGPNQSSSTMITNGKVTSSIAYSYVLQPKNIGKFTIGAAYVKVDDKTISSQPITVEVVDKPSSTQNNTTDQTTKQNETQADINKYIQENVLIKTEVSDQEIYKGEDITVTMKFCVKKNSSIYGYRIMQAVKVPKYDGFYATEIELSEQAAQTETINGEVYEVSTFKKTILTAQKAGKLEIDPITLDGLFGVQVKKQKSKSGDPMQDYLDDFFSNPFSSGNKEVRTSVSSSSVKVNVLELPPNAPADFNGAVGKFSMKTELNATSTKTDEPLTYRVIISGNGNLELFNAPVLNLPPGWETYDPKTSGTGNTKTYEYLLIPRSPGEFTIPSYSWSFFEPGKKKYETITSEQYKVNVEAGPGYNPSAGNYATNKEDVEMLANDIRYIKKSGPHYENEQNHFYGTGVFYTLLGLPFITGLGLFMLTAKRKKILKDHVALKYSKANSIAQKRLMKAKEFVTTNNAKAFYDEIIKTMWGYLGDKLNIKHGELSKENIYEVLLRQQVSESTANNTLQLLNTCEVSLFAPQLSSATLDHVYKDAIDLITKLETEIK